MSLLLTIVGLVMLAAGTIIFLRLHRALARSRRTAGAGAIRGNLRAPNRDIP